MWEGLRLDVEELGLEPWYRVFQVGRRNGENGLGG